MQEDKFNKSCKKEKISKEQDKDFDKKEILKKKKRRFYDYRNKKNHIVEVEE